MASLLICTPERRERRSTWRKGKQLDRSRLYYYMRRHWIRLPGYISMCSSKKPLVKLYRFHCHFSLFTLPPQRLCFLHRSRYTSPDMAVFADLPYELRQQVLQENSAIILVDHSRLSGGSPDYRIPGLGLLYVKHRIQQEAAEANQMAFSYPVLS